MEASASPAALHLLPSFHVRRRFFSPIFEVVAEWPSGRRLAIRQFCTRSLADYWLEVESAAWLERNADALTAAAA